VPQASASAATGTFPPVPDWAERLTAIARAALADFLLRQRWYPAKHAGRPEVVPAVVVPLAVPDTPAAAIVWQVTPPGHAPMRLFVPLALVPAAAADEAQVIAPAPASDDAASRLVEGFSVDGFVRAWIGAILRSERSGGCAGLCTGNTAALPAAGLAPGTAVAIRRGSAEQSNTSLRIGERAILKVYRKLEPGVQPELEVGRFLTEAARFAATPALFGWAELRANDDTLPMTVAILQAYVPNQGDGWDWVLERLARPEGVAETLAWLRRLGRRTAELHQAFAGATPDPAFRPEPVTADDRAAWRAAAEQMAQRALRGLAAAGDRLAADAGSLAATLLARRDTLQGRLRAALPEAPGLCKTRHHGDFHLGQVLVTGADAVIVDFEGEPLRPLRERRAKTAALRDVAGLLRSLAYAAAAAQRALPGADQEAREAYWEAARGGGFVPPEQAAAERLVRFFMVEKALYEIDYELAHRPDWVGLPLRGLLALLEADGEPAATPPPPGSGAPERSGDALDELAARMGIEPAFRNARGETVRASADTKRRLLAAMGVPATDLAAAPATLAALDRADWQRPLPPVAVLRADAAPLAVEVTLPAGTGGLGWRLALEDGGARSGRAAFSALPLLAERRLGEQVLQRRRLVLEGEIPWGYHRLTVAPGGAATTLIVAPGRCWVPPALAAGKRLWGLAVQLYLLRTATDWGIGDFGDLRSLVELAGARGADVIGLNPLHALFPDDPEYASPYSPASRLLLNVLNIDVLAVPQLPDCPPARERIAADEFRSRLDACRARHLVDYAEVAALKLPVLQMLCEAGRRDAAAWRRFEAFRRERGDVLERTCLFLALREHFAALDPARADWHSWPEEYRDPASPAVARFAQDHRARIDFLAWLQWTADQQLGAAATAAAERGMAVGLYRDLAVGADRAGAETWANPAAVVSGAEVGAPPDIYNPAGQNWGLPPFHPRALREEAYRSFIDLVRANMRHAGGLRIDHVMALQHLYWVPEGRPPSEGAYVAYPMDDLIGILALESHRNHCLVVGEDLGTVPEGFRERLAAAAILSYRVLFFEKDANGFLPPQAYPPLALAVAGSHDLPTLRGWWEAADLDLRRQLALFPRPADERQARADRARDRAQLLAAFRREGLLADGAGCGVRELILAAHTYLAQSRAAIAMAQIDDITEEVEPVNVPTTSDEHPNWRRRLALTLEQVAELPALTAVAEIFRRERGAARRGTADLDGRP
jgi:4-alpha-glucanotransferase